VHEDCAGACEAGQVGVCLDGLCECIPDLAAGDVGRDSDLAASPAGGAWVSAYNATFGDLMVARVTEPGRVPTEAFEFVDGVPDGPVTAPGSRIRGGVAAKGDDVGRYTSIAVGPGDEPLVSYYDATSRSLKLAQRQGEFWKVHTVDQAEGDEDAGRWSSLTLDADGRPAIAYFATVGEPGTGRSELRLARAATTAPGAAGDWAIHVADEAPLPAGEPGALPMGVGLFASSARMPSGEPVVAYYDRLAGDLRIAMFDDGLDGFGPPFVVDGDDGSDVGLHPSVAVDDEGTISVSYVDAVGHDLLFFTLIPDAVPEVIDDGYRIDGETSDGLPLPVYHFVGDDSSLTTTGALTAVAYQDATSHELLYAVKSGVEWTWTSIAGATPGAAYGFFASSAIDGDDILLSTYVLDQPNSDSWVEVFRVPAVEE
jgi:hypothetical protein